MILKRSFCAVFNKISCYCSRWCHFPERTFVFQHPLVARHGLIFSTTQFLLMYSSSEEGAITSPDLKQSYKLPSNMIYNKWPFSSKQSDSLGLKEFHLHWFAPLTLSYNQRPRFIWCSEWYIYCSSTILIIFLFKCMNNV